MERVNLIRRDKFRESSNLGFERDLTAWPQRNYACSFCKKQFKSAQALGGHMNVHRRDRAKLRSVNPNPNPNPSSSSPAASFLPYQSSFLTPPLAPFSSSPTSSVPKKEEKLQLLDPPSLSTSGVLKSLAAQEDKSRVLMTRGNTTVSLDLGMSLFRDAKEELDLELRLGYSS